MRGAFATPHRSLTTPMNVRRARQIVTAHSNGRRLKRGLLAEAFFLLQYERALKTRGQVAPAQEDSNGPRGTPSSHVRRSRTPPN